MGAFRNPSLTFGALIGAATVRERSSSDAPFLAVIALVVRGRNRNVYACHDNRSLEDAVQIRTKNVGTNAGTAG